MYTYTEMKKKIVDKNDNNSFQTNAVLSSGETNIMVRQLNIQ